MDTTSRMRGLHPNSQISTLGFLIAGVIFPGMIPLLPFFLRYLLVDWATSAGRYRGY